MRRLWGHAQQLPRVSVPPARPAPRADAELGTHPCQAHVDSRQTYGGPRLLHTLRQQGHRISRRRVRRLMRQQGLQTYVPRRPPLRPTAGTSSPSPQTGWSNKPWPRRWAA